MTITCILSELLSAPQMAVPLEFQLCDPPSFNEQIKTLKRRENNMSKDNGIYILKTSDSYIIEKETKVKVSIEDKRIAYRVAHVSAIDNFSQLEYEENLTDLHEYMKDNWGQSTVYYTIEDALICASKIYDSVKYLEYGINKIDGSYYDFFYLE